jgi:hypothetical protein
MAENIDYAAEEWTVSTGNDLVITPHDDTAANVTVDNLAVAQFMHLLLNNATVRCVIDTVIADLTEPAQRSPRAGHDCSVPSHDASRSTTTRTSRR